MFFHHPINAEPQNIPPGECIKRKAFQWKLAGWEAWICTTRTIAQLLLGVVLCMIFIADLTACRLHFSMSSRPVAPRLWSGFLVQLL